MDPVMAAPVAAARYTCNYCPARFVRKSDRTRHANRQHNAVSLSKYAKLNHRYDCLFCPATFARVWDRTRHTNRMHGAVPPVYPCIVCGLNFNNVQALHLHVEGHAPQQNDYERVEVMQGAAHTYRKTYLPPIPSIENTLGRDRDTLSNILAHEAAIKRYAKFFIVVIAEFVKVTPENTVHKSATIYLKTKSYTLTLFQDYNQFLRKCQAEIVVNAEDFVHKGSDWILRGVYRTELHIVKCAPLQGACGQLPVSLPKDILRFRQISADDDSACFFRCVARHFVASDDQAELDNWIAGNLDTRGFDLPFKVDRIAQFERRHRDVLDFKINVIYKVRKND